MEQKAGIGRTQHNLTGLLHIAFLECKKLHPLVSQALSASYIDSSNCTVHLQCAIGPWPTVPEEANAGTVLRDFRQLCRDIYFLQAIVI